MSPRAPTPQPQPIAYLLLWSRSQEGVCTRAGGGGSGTKEKQVFPSEAAEVFQGPPLSPGCPVPPPQVPACPPGPQAGSEMGPTYPRLAERGRDERAIREGRRCCREAWESHIPGAVFKKPHLHRPYKNHWQAGRQRVAHRISLPGFAQGELHLSGTRGHQRASRQPHLWGTRSWSNGCCLPSPHPALPPRAPAKGETEAGGYRPASIGLSTPQGVLGSGFTPWSHQVPVTR